MEFLGKAESFHRAISSPPSPLSNSEARAAAAIPKQGRLSGKEPRFRHPLSIPPATVGPALFPARFPSAPFL